MRALPLCLTTLAARSSVSPTVCACSPAEKRSPTAELDWPAVGLARRDGRRGLVGRGVSSRPVRSSVICSPVASGPG